MFEILDIPSDTVTVPLTIIHYAAYSAWNKHKLSLIGHFICLDSKNLLSVLTFALMVSKFKNKNA